MNNEDMAGRIMAHAFNDELEKIALNQSTILSAAEKAAKRAKDLEKAYFASSGKGINTSRIGQAVDRRSDQASRLLQGLTAGTMPETGFRGSAKLTRDQERMISNPVFRKFVGLEQLNTYLRGDVEKPPTSPLRECRFYEKGQFNEYVKNF